MTFDQIRTFLVVSDVRNLSRAAELLHFSQPAVSQQILAIEKHLGQRLFERKKRTLELTVAGMRFLAYARALMRDTESMLTDVKGMNETLQGVVKIGAVETAGIYRLPSLIANFQTEHPSIRVHLKIAAPEHLFDELAHGNLDFAILDLEIPPTRSGDFAVLPMANEEYRLALPPEHPWAEREDIAPEELYETEWVLPLPDSSRRENLDAKLRALGIDPSRLIASLEIGSLEGIRQSVQQGLGIAILPEALIQSGLRTGQLAQASLSQRLDQSFSLYTPRNPHLRVETFQKYLMEVFAPTSHDLCSA